MSTRTPSTRQAALNAREQWQSQIFIDSVTPSKDFDDEEWVAWRDPTMAVYRYKKAIETNQVKLRAANWLATGAPRKPLGRWAKNKVWSETAEMYV
jgi:hypothetical protein